MSIQVFKGDLPEGFQFTGSLAIDTETMGLNPHRDRLCVVQIADETGQCVLVHFPSSVSYEAPRLRKALQMPVEKIFHYARFDVATLYRAFGMWMEPVFCTKIASRLTRTYTERHGLKDLCRELLSVEISKQEQTSDWGANALTDAQIQYAANDVLFLHQLRAKCVELLRREGREEIAYQLFQAIKVRAHLDLLGWGDADLFAHS